MTKMELVFVPIPGMGHLPSTVRLAKLILQRDHRISVVVLMINFPHDNAIVNAYIDSQSRDADPTTRLTFISLPALASPPDPSSPNFFATVVELNRPLVKEAVLDRIQSKSAKPVGFIVDMFCTTMIDVANELHVASYVFFTSGATLLNLMFRIESLVAADGINFADEFGDDLDKEIDLPGFRNRVPGKVIPSAFLNKEGGSQWILNHMRRFRESNGILVNTYLELESYANQALLEEAGDNKIPAVYPVGPILELNSKSYDGSHQKEEHESIMEWLDQQPPSSVVFLCFGSMGSFEEVQVKEIANGLERAGHRFLWSLRIPPPEGSLEMPSEHETFVDALPEGFLERTAHRGKIIAWAPQVAILAHEAVGGFLSHCGWNSTLESLWFGVPMAAWPMFAEQQLNAFVLVKELGIAVEIRMDYQMDWKTKKGNFVVTADEIENGVKKLMNMDEDMRGKVKEMSENGRKAFQDGGSSRHWLGRFIADVLQSVA